MLLLAGSYAFRLPALLNARSTNSDAAVVGLQAMHILRGEAAPFLWGSGYQTATDSFVAAAFFALFGASPLVLMLSALTLHVLGTWFVFATLRRRFTSWTALLLTLPLVVSPSSVHSYALYPPRQASLTLALAAFWAIDSASEGSERARWTWLASGGALALLAVGADPYPLVLLPAIGVFGLTTIARDSRIERFGTIAKRFQAFALGAGLGLLPFIQLHRLAGAKKGPMGLTTNMVSHHVRLLVDECLPWALSYKVYYAHHVMDYLPWDAPLAFRLVGIVGAVLLGAIVCFGLVSPFVRAIPWNIRRLGFAGALAFPTAIGGFLVSVMVMDHFSMRYLAVLTLMAPFAAAPAARFLGTRRFALVFAPHLVASAVAGWVGYGPFVRGALPVIEAPELRDDYQAFDLLRARGITYAEADYWTAYRLTLLADEKLVVVPTNAVEDRYPPYRRAFESAPVFAYVHDPGRSRENLEGAEKMLAQTNAQVEKLHAGALTIFVVTR
ncbi:Membrane protein [Labilithrix luteola]|uniref:Membrane protein n=1 Tax=Labilithrix luteola TaxID=1391654 RepID=A0A0K1PMF7_9BACT|nr:Membrane protein [Labilithrix luteola]